MYAPTEFRAIRVVCSRTPRNSCRLQYRSPPFPQSVQQIVGLKLPQQHVRFADLLPTRENHQHVARVLVLADMGNRAYVDFYLLGGTLWSHVPFYTRERLAIDYPIA